MAGRKKVLATASNSSQPSITNWLSTARSNPTSGTKRSSGDMNGARSQRAPKRLAGLGPDSNTPRLKPTVSFGSSNLSSPPPSEPTTPLRRSTRIRASATPAPAPATISTTRRNRVIIPQTPPPRMSKGIKGPSPLRDKPRRTSPPYYWTVEGYRDPSDTDEVPSSQKDDAEPIDDDIETLESIPIFHMSSPPTSLSSEELSTPTISTPPRPLSPDSKARSIVAEVRANARVTASSNSLIRKRSHSPSDDSDSDALPDAAFFFGNKAHPNKRRASTTPSPNQARRPTRKSKRLSLSPVVLISKPKAAAKPAPNPFAAIVRERAARAKREESLPRAPDGSRQDLFAIANAALLRDPDADELGADGGSQDASAALNQLAEGGFAAEAEMVRKAGSTQEALGWGVFARDEGTKGDMLAKFPDDVAALLNTQHAKKVWGWISERMNAHDYATVEEIISSNLVEMTFSDPREHTVLEPLIKWLIELVTLSPPSSSFPLGASRQASLLIRHLPDSEAQDRVALHIVRCALRAGPPGGGVYLGRSILDRLSAEPDEASFMVPSETQRCSRVWLCAGMLKHMTRTKEIFPVLSVLCLLGLDPALQVTMRSDIAETAELWACKAESTEAQLIICSTLADALADLPIQQKRDLVLRVLRGTRPVGVQLCMWLATAFLDGKGMKGVSPQMYRARPPLERILDYTRGMHITPDTNYSDLLATAQLLDIALWDVAALVEVERSEGRVVKYQPGVPINSMVTDVIDKLAEVHGRILDARAADLERTRTKAYLQTLQVRLGWDLIEAARSGQKTAKTIREMWGKPRPVAA